MYGRSRTIHSDSVAPVTAARAEARRLAAIASFFVWGGWFLVIYAGIGGLLWWVELTSLQHLTLLEALGMSLQVVAGPLFLALIIAALGHFARLFALYVAEHSGN